MVVWLGLTNTLASLDCWVTFLVRSSMEYTEYVLGLLMAPFHSSPAILLECLQNALSFWISSLREMLLCSQSLPCKEQRQREAFLCPNSELHSDTRCVRGGEQDIF